MQYRRNRAAALPAMPFGPPPPPMAFSPPYWQPPMPYPPAQAFLPPPPPPPNFLVPPAAPAHPYHYAPAAPPMPLPPPQQPQLRLRSVTAANLDEEMQMIGDLMLQYPYITIDVEYAGIVHQPPVGMHLTPDERYAVVKSNVDEVPVVHLGIILSDAQGNLPLGPIEHARPHHEIAWEVVFSDFDVDRDPHVVSSVEFLEDQGVDFELARHTGVSSTAFGERLLAVLLLLRRDQLTWSAFGGAYDMAYLIRMLTGGQPLPESRQEFWMHMRFQLGGGRIFDSRYMVEHERQ